MTQSVKKGIPTLERAEREVSERHRPFPCSDAPRPLDTPRTRSTITRINLATLPLNPT